MNDWQICQQVVHLIKTLTWSVSGDKIFFSGSTTGDDITVSPVDPQGIMKIHTLPCAIVRPLDKKTVSFTEPRLEEVEFTMEIVLCVSVPGDGDAGSSLLGRNVLAGDVGRGLLEIEEKIQEKLELLMDWENIRFSFHGASSAKIGMIDEVGNFCSRSLLYDVRGTRYRTYGPPRRLRRTGSGSSVVLTWELPATRFDFTRVVLRRHTSKITAVTDGTSITLSGDTAITVTNSPGTPGTYYYAIFGGYTEPGNATVQYSEPINLKVTVT